MSLVMIMWSYDFLKILFSGSLGGIALLLLWQSIFDEKGRKRPGSRKAGSTKLLFLAATKDGVPFLRMPLLRNHYLIGRAADCDVRLPGPEIPLYGVKMIRDEDDGQWHLKMVPADEGSGVNHSFAGHNRTEIIPGRPFVLYNYRMEIE
jgi:hypothetical protein